MDAITPRIGAIRAHIAQTHAHSALSVDMPVLLAASKGQSADTIEAAIRAGITDFGENRVQEALEKWPPLKKKYPHIRLHLIGALQTNKVREAMALFDVVQTIDRPKLALEIARGEGRGARGEERIATPNPHPATRQFYIQINTGEEPQKSGIAPKDAAEFIGYCRSLELNVVGLMCVPPVQDPPAPHFALLQKIAAENGLNELSMGMSSDYETAIRMGSTCVRIGTALFGKRDDKIIG